MRRPGHPVSIHQLSVSSKTGVTITVRYLRNRFLSYYLPSVCNRQRTRVCCSRPNGRMATLLLRETLLFIHSRRRQTQSPETPGASGSRSAQHSRSIQSTRSSGDTSAVAPPVPIPNTEVKRCSPDDSASIGCAKVGRRQYPRPAQVNPRAGRPFFTHSSFPSAHTPQRAIGTLLAHQWRT